MRALVYADLQADLSSELLFSDPTQSLRLHCVKKFYAELSSLCAEHACDAVYDLGDTFDDRNALDYPSLNAVIGGLNGLKVKGPNFRIIGNHDQFQKDGSVHNGCVLERFFHTVADRQIQAIGDCMAFFVSYPADHAELTEWLLKEVKRFRGPKILFGHFQAKGAFYKGGTALTGIPLEALAPFNLVLLGHIHLPQSLSDRIHYVGSPFQQDWGEAQQTKRVGIVDTNTMTVEWVPLKGYPEYRSVDLAAFKQQAQAGDEHRYRVTLNSQTEAEQFFALPNCNRAVARYNYTETSEAAEQAENHDWSFEGTCRRYLKTVPPNKVGIDMSDDDMIAISAQMLSR
jgi:DNA repair exonuclease SbcCD nuclease subunit